MIPTILEPHIRKVEQLKVVSSIENKDYSFDPDLRILYIPASETDFSGMFTNYYNLKRITIAVDNKIETSAHMFLGCINLKEIIFKKKLNLARVKSLSAMFSICRALEKINLSNVITSDKLQNISNIFYNCYALKEINFGEDFHSENILKSVSAFNDCPNLKHIYWRSHQPFSSVEYTHKMFKNCKNLKQIDLRGMNFKNVVDSYNMFDSTATSLEVLVNNTFPESYQLD